MGEIIETQIRAFGLWQKLIFFFAGLTLLPANLFLPAFVGFLPKVIKEVTTTHFATQNWSVSVMDS